jgi:hypothetical protein
MGAFVAGPRNQANVLIFQDLGIKSRPSGRLFFCQNRHRVATRANFIFRTFGGLIMQSLAIDRNPETSALGLCEKSSALSAFLGRYRSDDVAFVLPPSELPASQASAKALQHHRRNRRVVAGDTSAFVYTGPRNQRYFARRRRSLPQKDFLPNFIGLLAMFARFIIF